MVHCKHKVIAKTTKEPIRRHRTDEYLDTLYANQTARKVSAPIIPKVAIARWQTALDIISLILPNQSQ